jgi:xylulokinase
MGIHSRKYLIGLDLGTSSIKGVLMDEDGNVCNVTAKQIECLNSQDGWVESDPEVHRKNVFEVIRELTEHAPAPISALAMAAASGNSLLTSADGTPLTNIINWMDRRSVNCLPESLKGLAAESVRQITGWPCVDIFPLAQLGWLKENKSELYTQASRYCMNTDWLLFQLTGNWVMDHSTATTFHLQDQITKCYHQPFLDRLNITEEKLSRLVPSGVAVGRLTDKAAEATGLSVETEVISGCFDHPAAARAVGVLEPGKLMLSCGTSWVGFFPELERQNIINAELLCDPFLESKGGPWGAIFSVPYIGQTIDQYVREIIAPNEPDPYGVFNESATAVSGTGELEIDLREPAHTPAASREQISRAVMESAARLLNEKIVELSACDIEFDKAVIVGGPSHSPVWIDIIKNITGLELSVGDAYCGAKGAAMLAGVGVGVFSDEEDAFRKCNSGDAQ